MIEFASKRNRVYLKDGVVHKECENSNAAILEQDFIDLLDKEGVPVGRVIERDENVLLLEYIEGKTIPDFLEEIDSKEKCGEVAEWLAEWFDAYYRAVQIKNPNEIRGDVNGRNFLITKTGVVGVDFEEHVFGTQEVDAGRLLAFIETYDIEGDHAQKELGSSLHKEFLERLLLDESQILIQKNKELIEMKKRRK